MGRYLPADDTRVFLTRVKAPAVSPAASEVPSEPSASLEESCEAGQAGQSGQTDDDTTEQAFVGKSDTRPWLFAFVGVVSLCLTQSLYYYLRGENSVYVDYERGCGEWCFEGEPSQTQYFIVKLLAVACSYFAIAGATVFARWASNCLGSLRCPLAAGTSTSRPGAAAVPRKSELSAAVPVEFGRPDMAALIDAAVAEVGTEATLPTRAGGLTHGLFVCVCGPDALVQSCKDAVKAAKRNHKGVAVGLHAEEPDW